MRLSQVPPTLEVPPAPHGHILVGLLAANPKLVNALLSLDPTMFGLVILSMAAEASTGMMSDGFSYAIEVRPLNRDGSGELNPQPPQT
jgi:hypothetical protein